MQYNTSRHITQHNKERHSMDLLPVFLSRYLQCHCDLGLQSQSNECMNAAALRLIVTHRLLFVTAMT